MLTLCFCLYMLFIHPAQGQAEPPDLVVRVHNAQGAALAGVTVQVRADEQELASAQTDASGTATFARLTENNVRVRVRGTAPNGVPLVLPGRDADGVALLLAAPPTELNLRVESDDMVRPDPATMIVPDVGAPSFEVPTNAAQTTAEAATPVASSTPPITPVAAAPAPQGARWLGWLLLIVLLVAISTLLWMNVRRRSNG